LRREVAPVLVLVRPQRELVADVVGAARDPGVFRTLRAALRARPQPEAEHRNQLGPLGRRQQGVASHHKCRRAIHVRRRGFGHRPVHPTGTSRPPRGGTLHRNVDAHGALGSRCRPARRAGGRAGHRVDRGAAGTRGGEGGQERVLGAAVAHLDPAEARPALHLLARRHALSLRVEDLVPVLRVDLRKYRSRETGALEVGPELVDELIAMEEFVAGEVDRILNTAPAAGTVTLQAAVNQREFEDAYPDARSLRDLVPYPMSLQHVAAGRAAAELSRRGRDVEVHRGDRRGDLTVRRLAAGLLKDETARLLGIDEKRYAKFERAAAAPPAGLVAELQAVDDFVTTSAGQLEVTETAGVSIVILIDDQAEFERAY